MRTADQDQIGDPNSGAPHTLLQWFNKAAYANIPDGEVRAGTSHRGAINGPGVFRWDASLLKNTKISERVNLQFRAEASNVLNHTNYDTIRTTLQSGSFGQVRSTRDPRILQLGLKLEF